MKKSFFYLLVFVCSFAVVAGEYYQAIQVLHDPFQKPNIPQKTAEPEAGKATLQQEQAWSPELKATLRAGRNSMANVNGKIIKLGDTINGFSLIEIGERSAVFIKNKQRIRLTVKDEPGQ